MAAAKSAKPLIPFWAQALVGLTILALVIFLVAKTSFYTSDWSETNSNFYRNGSDALIHSRINVYQGPVPTLVVFWDMDCAMCKDSLSFLSKIRDPINVVGVHLSCDEMAKTKARQWWLANAPRKAPLYFDSQNMMEKTFQIRVVPASFLIFPLQQKMLAHSGNLRWSKPDIKDLVREMQNKVSK